MSLVTVIFHASAEFTDPRTKARFVKEALVDHTQTDATGAHPTVYMPVARVTEATAREFYASHPKFTVIGLAEPAAEAPAAVEPPAPAPDAVSQPAARKPKR